MSRGWKRMAALAGLGLLGALSASPAWARLDIWDLKLGTKAADMPAWIEFKDYACGSNGGPPLKALTGWADFAQCAPEADGLHEVYFEYDDEDEYIARAHEDIRIGRNAGTTDKSFPIITSALFDDAGVLQGIRIVTDPRPGNLPDSEFATLRPREEHYLLGSYLASQFQVVAATDCTEIPLGDRESEVGGTAVKQDCERTDAAKGVHYAITQRFFRKAGQNDRDPHTGALTQGQYESLTRAEVRLVGAN